MKKIIYTLGILLGVSFLGGTTAEVKADSKTVQEKDVGITFYYDDEEDEEDEKDKEADAEKKETVYTKSQLPQTGEAASGYLVVAGMLLFYITVKGGRYYVIRQDN